MRQKGAKLPRAKIHPSHHVMNILGAYNFISILFVYCLQKWKYLYKKALERPVAAAHTPVIPVLWEAKAGRSPEVTSSRPAGPIWLNPFSTKNTKISWVWWRVPVVPATREAEAGELLEPRKRRLQWAEIVPLHSSLAPGDRMRLCLKKKKKKR